MRKYLYAGALAGGLLLLGAAPAYADTNGPDATGGPNSSSTSGLLGHDGHLKLDNPLGDAKVLDVKPGSNSPDVTGAAGQLPAARTGLGQAGDASPLSAAAPVTGAVRSVLPGAADTEGLPGGLGGGGGLSGLPVVGGLLGGGLPVVGGGGLPVGGGGGGLPVVGGGGLPVGGGGLPIGGGGLPVGGDDRPVAGGAQESGLVPADLPLLGGGLGGLLPFAMPQTPGFDGLPAGGTAVDQPASSDQSDASDQPVAADQPAPAVAATKKPKAPKDAATASDSRVHEEPVDTEGGGRQFSSGRPVAGTDPDFK